MLRIELRILTPFPLHNQYADVTLDIATVPWPHITSVGHYECPLDPLTSSAQGQETWQIGEPEK